MRKFCGGTCSGKKIGLILIAAVVLVVLAGCGGSSKVLTPGEYENLPPANRIEYLNQQIAKHPDDLVLKKQLSQEYLRLEMLPQAAAVMEEIIAADPYQVDVQFEYGKLQYQQGNLKDAYGSFLSVLQTAAGEVYKTQIESYVGGKYVVQQVTQSPEDEAFPVFSKDGQKLLYQKRDSTSWDIVELDLQSNQETVLVSTPYDEELPVYDPLGNGIAYASTEEDHRPIGPKYKVREITYMALKDGFIANLTQSVADDWLPRYSHDGKYMVFVSERNDLRKVDYVSKQSDIFIMERDGDFQLQLTDSPANEGGPCFDGDDSHIYFHSDKNGTFDIFVMKTDGSQVMTVIDNPDGNDVNPHVSDDSQYLTFMSDRDGNYEIYRARTNGSEQERLTFNPAVDSNPVFSPDGQAIAFHSNRSGNFDIFIINLNASSGSLTTAQLIERLEKMAN